LEALQVTITLRDIGDYSRDAIVDNAARAAVDSHMADSGEPFGLVSRDGVHRDTNICRPVAFKIPSQSVVIPLA